MRTSTAVFLSGLFDLALALAHVAFWRLFGWPKRLAPLDTINRGLIQVENLALIALFALVGIALIVAAAEAPASLIGRVLLIGMALFWLARAAVQVPYFGSAPISLLLIPIALLGAALHALPFVLR